MFTLELEPSTLCHCIIHLATESWLPPTCAILIKSDYTNNSSPVSPIDKPSDIESTTSERQLTRLIRLYNDNNNNNQEKPYISIHPEGMNLYMRLGAVGKRNNNYRICCRFSLKFVNINIDSVKYSGYLFV
ncbi:unnamed protein product [Schistosoma mattheei]|uniref:Uncharacterized protein n=1 Tax=Schistosoma mattheei TaxID=31246 RepID=A0A183NLP7_9TREM|nr:unnamed protein product [Schistosoma mattheei]